jgi:hypothetical protein
LVSKDYQGNKDFSEKREIWDYLECLAKMEMSVQKVHPEEMEVPVLKVGSIQLYL